MTTEPTYHGIVCQVCGTKTRTVRTRGCAGFIIRIRECLNLRCRRRFQSREILTKTTEFNLPLPSELAASADVPSFGPGSVES